MRGLVASAAYRGLPASLERVPAPPSAARDCLCLLGRALSRAVSIRDAPSICVPAPESTLSAHGCHHPCAHARSAIRTPRDGPSSRTRVPALPLSAHRGWDRSARDLSAAAALAVRPSIL